MKTAISIAMIAIAAWLALSAAVVRAQAPETPPPEVLKEAPGMVTFNLPEEVDLKVLIDYVGKRQGVSFIYDEQIGARKVTIKANQKIPADSLMALLESALKMKGLAMSRTEVAGMMRIELAKQLTTVSSGPVDSASAQSPREQSGLAVTRVFEIRHANQQRIEQVVAPFLSVPTANLTVLTDLGIAVVTDYADNMKRIEQIIATVDRPGRKVTVRFAPVANVDAASIAQKLTLMLAGKSKARGAAADPTAGVTVIADDRTNQVGLVGSFDEVEEAVALVASLDIPLGLTTKIYTFVTASPEQVDRLVKTLIGELTAKRLYKSTIDREANILVATATVAIHEQIEALRKSLDKPQLESQSPIRFYKLENAKAAEVLATLQSIEGDSGLGDASVDGVSARSSSRDNIVYKGPTEASINNEEARPEDSITAAKRPRAVQLRNARVMADEPSNTLIVVAKPSMHPVYEKLIKRLDIRRPQVLVEATVVIIDTSNNFTLGVEISKTSSVNDGEGRLLNFSSFGLSQVDPDTGALTLKPGVGFNGALISSDIANIIIRALDADSRAKVISKPSVLINDNATGRLLSENEEPFSTVTASGVAGATTSFGGFASAGTNIEITPQISEGEHLKLKYKITLSSFTGTSSSALPPSRQKNTLESEATIPDGYTIVVGGLTRENFKETIDRIPVLGRIPIIEYAFSNRSTTKSQGTLFVFLRAMILRDDQFEDLKVLSGTASNKAEIPGDNPKSEPVEIH